MTDQILSRYTPQGRKRARYEMQTRYAGSPGYVPSDPIQAHIITLVDLGLPTTSIARDCGCALACIARIYRGAWPTTRIRTATAIMAVTVHPNARQETVLAIGAIRRLRALHAIGWSWRVLEHQHIPTVSHKVMSNLTRDHHGQTTTTWQRWAAIRDVYEKLSGTPGVDGSAQRARNAATANGWPAPLDWEDIDIDDPRVEAVRSGAATVDMRAVAVERRRRVRELVEAGLSAQQIADRVGIDPRTVVRYKAEFRQGRTA